MKGVYEEGNLGALNSEVLRIVGESKVGVILTCSYTYGNCFHASGTSSLSISQMTIRSGTRNVRSIILFDSHGSLLLDDIKMEQTVSFYFI
jgi:hypothetical protein